MLEVVKKNGYCPVVQGNVIWAGATLDMDGGGFSDRMKVMVRNATSFYKDMLGVISTSTAIFYKYYDEEFRYADLYRRICEINGVLSGRAREVVALYTGKSFDVYAGIYATILSNNIWLPLSQDLPPERNIVILRSAKPSIFFHDGNLPPVIREYLDEQGIMHRALGDLCASDRSDTFDLERFHPDDVAYIMFTSGSTGVPKGVPMTHANYINFVENALAILPFTSEEVFADFHDFAFDISIFYLFCVLFVEGAISPIVEQKDKIVPVNHILRNGITVWASVPTVIARMKQMYAKRAIETQIRIMFLCGEPLKIDILEYCFQSMGLANVYNFYGLTETGVENFYHRCERGDIERYRPYGMVPIGTPLPGNAAAISEEKELLLSGCQITPGYLNGVQRERFLECEGVVWYRSGDIVERVGDVYFCKGRLDSQVKISGHRVDLLDIEANLVAHVDGIAHAACAVSEEEGKKTILAAVIAEKPLEAEAIQAEILKHVPRYMVPQRIRFLEAFPVNANGKVDRGRILEMFSA